MRIIAGKARGLRLATPSNYHVRPTADRVKEALFSILGDLEGAIIVDGFAGTGALGCEALSRGAARCYFFDKSGEAVETVEENIRRIKGAGQALVEKCGFEVGFSRHLEDEPDLFFLDPPYGSGLAYKALIAMAENPRVTEGALAVVETGVEESRPKVEGWTLEDEREYGRTRLLFYYRRSLDRRVIEEGSE
jgi:16S rRNA (guanine966-N2)-methyltransferase